MVRWWSFFERPGEGFVQRRGCEEWEGGRGTYSFEFSNWARTAIVGRCPVVRRVVMVEGGYMGEREREKEKMRRTACEGRKSAAKKARMRWRRKVREGENGRIRSRESGRYIGY